MSHITLAMLVVLGLGAAIALAPRLIPTINAVFGTVVAGAVYGERPNASLLRVGESAKLISLKFKSKPDQFDLVGTLEAAGESTTPPLPTIIAPADSPLGRRLIGLVAEPKDPEPRLSLAAIKPWVFFGGAIVVSVVVLGMARHVIVHNKDYSADDLKAAWASITAIVGFWVGKASS